jgi:hypothetical protein
VFGITAASRNTRFQAARYGRQYAAIGRCLWKWERPQQEVEPAPGPPLPNLHLWGVQVGRNGETPARTLQFLCAPEHSSVTGRAAGQGPVGRGPQACFAKLTLGLHSLARLRAENISPVFARPGRSSLQRPE